MLEQGATVEAIEAPFQPSTVPTAEATTTRTMARRSSTTRRACTSSACAGEQHLGAPAPGQLAVADRRIQLFQGLEAALDNGWVRDAESARTWLVDQLQLNLARFEAPPPPACCAPR